jgi:peptidoglycan DL-endopeptidase RipA
VRPMNVNDSGTDQVARIVVERPGAGVIQDESWSAASGEWKPGPTANVAMATGDEFRYYLGDDEIVRLSQNAIPYYMSHCRVTTSSSTVVNSAISYGLAQLGSYYTGCWGGDYRMGAVAPRALTFDGRNCGQSWVYSLPAGGKGFDCSGFVYRMLQHAGVAFPYQSTRSMVADRSGVLDPVSRDAMRPGDLLLKNGHVGMYVGNNLVLESSPDHGGVVEWVSGSARQVTEGVHLANLSHFPASSYTVQRVRGM